MIYEIKLPQEGMLMTNADIGTWLIDIGDTVEVGQDIAEVEAAKSNFTIQSPYAGKVVELVVEEGDTADVGEVIARLEGE